MSYTHCFTCYSITFTHTPTHEKKDYERGKGNNDTACVSGGGGDSMKPTKAKGTEA